MSYWAQWAWDFPHLAVGFTEYILAFSVTHYATDPRPSVWKQPTDPAVHPNDWPVKQCARCGCNITSATFSESEGWLCVRCGQKMRARIDPAIDDRMMTGEDGRDYRVSPKPPPNRSDYGPTDNPFISYSTGIYALDAERRGWLPVKGAPGWWVKP